MIAAPSQKRREEEEGRERERETISHQRKDFSREIIPGPKEKSPNEGKNTTREKRQKRRCRAREGGKKSVQSSALSGRATPPACSSACPLVDKSRDLHYLLLPQRQKATRRVILRGRGGRTEKIVGGRIRVYGPKRMTELRRNTKRNAGKE